MNNSLENSRVIDKQTVGVTARARIQKYVTERMKEAGEVRSEKDKQRGAGALRYPTFMTKINKACGYVSGAIILA
ncbi:MAG: hypothetical protein FWG51_03465, partial [Firmicutes bacterium]|nr:hypothetical protein [Bacillota bacterium]